MNKKYEILNSKSEDDCTIFYILYIVLIFVVIFIIYKIIYNFTYSERFNNLLELEKYNGNDNDNLQNIYEPFTTSNTTSNPTLNMTHSNEILQELIEKNNQLTNIKNTIQDRLEKQSNAIYISQTYDKVDSSSFDDEMIFLLYEFSNTKFPEIDTDNKKFIQTQPELESVLSEAKLMKNFYKPGDIVTVNSTFGISKNDICHRHNGKLIKPTEEFLQKYPECMVCSVESENNVYDTNSWKNTKTNIDKVYLYNPAAESNSGIPNISDCQKFCGIKVPKIMQTTNTNTNTNSNTNNNTNTNSNTDSSK